MSEERHELFEELEAFHPTWHKVYHNLQEAVQEASFTTPYVLELYKDFLATQVRSVDGVPDIIKYKQECDQLDAESALPFGLGDLGSIPGGQG